MKKKTLPILLLLAGLSAAALAGCGHEHTYSWKQSEDGATHWQECECGEKTEPIAHVDANSDEVCDDCGYNMHVHAPEWKSDADQHWKECECGDKTEEGPHKDENSDDKCDDCERAYFAVTFEMHDHGTAPAAQKVISGGTVKAPDAPADEDAIKFKGWFKDAKYETPFDFEKDTVEAATTIHAKWEEDETEGASKAHAYELTKDVDCLKPAKNSVTYFKYVAEAAGRYTVALGIGANSQNATFTTSVTGDAVYGKDHAESAIFDLEKDQTVYIMFTFLGEESEEATAGVSIGDTVDEPLPEDHFLDGLYENEDYTITITVDREKKTVTYYEVAYPFTYIGGSVDSIYFTIADEWSSTKYTVHHEDDGTYSVSTNGQKVATMRKYVAPTTPIALNAISGYYEPKEEATYGISELYIYASESETSTTVRYCQEGYYSNTDAEYDTEKNRLTFNYSTVVTINLAEDGSIANISVGGNVYERKGEAGTPIPSKLGIEEGSEYVGDNYEIRDMGYAQYFGTGFSAITITDFDGDTGTYTISIYDWQTDTDTIYKLTISEDGNTITLCDEDGEQIDTLAKFSYIYHEFPADGDEVAIAAIDFQKNSVYLYKIETAGWYAFTDVPDDVSIYYGLNENSPLVTYEAHLVGEDAVYLNEDAIVGVFMDETAAISF
ncbi:MAG: InlB B-repeat-containing protein, partial [Clostridia bacterium]|nr:InlB B-repeat-containing protein [Clostridia bacterium]